MIKPLIKRKQIILFFVVVFLLLLLLPFLFKKDFEILKLQYQKINHLTYSDLVALSTKPHPAGRLLNKLNKQLSTPYVFNNIDLFRNSKFDKNFIRIAHWNIERGFNVEPIKKYFENGTVPQNKEVRDFINSDIICLNEVDIGMPRTKYKNIVSELSKSINYNYAFATEFIELSPIVYKLPHDPKHFSGLHGNAILSKYPIRNARTIRLPECYKWYETEIGKKSPLEHARRLGAETIFKEKILSEVRHGGRNALIADIELPNREIITIISTHLEDRCYPDGRYEQIKYLLDNVKYLRRPVVLAGDLNTTTTDAAPTSFKKEFVKRLRDPHFIARQLAFAAIPGAPIAGSFVSVALSKVFQYKDPASPSIPVLFPNEERKLFNYIRDFTFADGQGFDTRGDSEKSSNGKGGLLANSNERQLKGFESTFKFEEPRLVAYFKLDWFFVKPRGKRFEPFNGQTLKLVNLSPSGKISDHDPITVDLSI